VLAIGFFGAIIARFRPRGMSNTLFAAAIAQMIVPVIALIFWPADFAPGAVKVFVLNAGFAVMFAGSGLLFRQSSEEDSKVGALA
jgi:hypothetical protein